MVSRSEPSATSSRIRPRRTPRKSAQSSRSLDSTPTKPRRSRALLKLPSKSPVTYRRIISPNSPNKKNIRGLFREIYGKIDAPVYSALTSNILPWRWWRGASNDIMTLAWSSDGTKFAAGAVSHNDEYNRGNNLVLGELMRNSLVELPDHHILSQRYYSNAPFPFHASYPQFTTVSASQWIGDRLFTASFDQTVKIWDTTGDGCVSTSFSSSSSASTSACCVETLKHDSRVVGMAHSSHSPSVLATASESFQLWDLQNGQTCIPLPIQRKSRSKEFDLVSTTLAWGQTSNTSRLLVGGMGTAERTPNYAKMWPRGHLQVWSIDESSISSQKVVPDSQHIFDIKWHPTRDQFATAGTILGIRLPRCTRSVVQIYDLSSDKSTVTHRFPCPALDINEVTFCPRGFYVTASCTDGSTYVWDERVADKVLHKLSHGPSLLPLSTGFPSENVDFGVGAAVWGNCIDQFFTGSSDGVLKQWDIRYSTEDALVTNTATFNAGITCGVFSGDKSHLLIGESGGGIQILSSGPCCDPEPGEMQFFPADRSFAASTGAQSESGQPSFDEGVELQTEAEMEVGIGKSYADELLKSNQLSLHPIYGPVQGPEYCGPFARWARGVQEDEDEDLDLRKIPLLKQYKLRQFDGPRVEKRNGLNSEEKESLMRYFHTARARAEHAQRRIEEANASAEASNSPKKKRGADRNAGKTRKTKNAATTILRKKRRVITKIDQGIIDLTDDNNPRGIIDLTGLDMVDMVGSGHDSPNGLTARSPARSEASSITLRNTSKAKSHGNIVRVSNRVRDKIIKEEEKEREKENLDDDFWWPDSRVIDANLNLS